MALLPRRVVVGSAFAAALIGLAGCDTSPQQASGGDVDLSLYRNVLDRVRSSYVDPVSDDQLVANSLKGMVTALDPHSDYMTESEYQDMLDDNSGEFAGIGAELTRDESHPKVISPIEDTPAARAGIKPGDVILKIDGKLTDGLSLKDAVDQLRGPAGTQVRLTIGRRDEKPFDVTLIRAVIHVASVKWELEPKHIGYARITTFAEKTQQELTSALYQMKQQSGGQLDGFVLDLRNDPGGLLDEAVDVAGDFLDGGTVVSTRGRDPDDNHTYHAPGTGDRLRGVPVVVLINGASASASEIVAGALQDRHRAEIIGTRSFGKGSVQTIIPFDGKGALRLTTARYYTPSGRSIQAQGIVPDDFVAPPANQRTADEEMLREADLRGALAAPNGGDARTAAAHPRPGDEVSDEAASIDPSIIGTAQDYQLAKALATVRALEEKPLARTQDPGSR
ncbi:MAG TPA: S41 family peptidase [Stellaceae bacterium]|nr:S41 family peptidase [Stellaceae bacterium]